MHWNKNRPPSNRPETDLLTSHFFHFSQVALQHRSDPGCQREPHASGKLLSCCESNECSLFSCTQYSNPSKYSKFSRSLDNFFICLFWNRSQHAVGFLLETQPMCLPVADLFATRAWSSRSVVHYTSKCETISSETFIIFLQESFSKEIRFTMSHPRNEIQR